MVYLAELIEVQNLSLHMRESDLGSLQLPELCNLIQKVELNPSEGLDRQEREERGQTLNAGAQCSAVMHTGHLRQNYV